MLAGIELCQQGEPSLAEKLPGIAEAFQIGEDFGDGTRAVVPLLAFEEEHGPVAAQQLFGAAENVQLVALDVAFQEGNLLSAAGEIPQVMIEPDDTDLDGVAGGRGGAGGLERRAGRGASVGRNVESQHALAI